MKHIALLLLLLANISVISAQDIDHNQALSDLISTKKWFEIERYYQQHKEDITSDFVKLCYLAETGNVFNQPLEAIAAYERLIDDNPLNMNTLTLFSLFANPALQLCADIQEFEKGREFCQKLITLIEKETSIDSNTRLAIVQGMKEAEESFKQFSNIYPKVTIIRNETSNAREIELIPSALTSRNDILFTAKWNGIKLKTIFDTGASLSYIYNRAIAEKIGVKLNTTDTIIMNESYEGAIRAFMGTIDSLELGDFIIKNVPVCVNIETIDPTDSIQAICDSLINSMFEIVLGLPVIKQLGFIELDFDKKTISFPQKTTMINQRNLYIEKNILFMNIDACNANLLTHFDTGNGEGLSINTDFYEKNKACISLGSQVSQESSGVGGCNEASIQHRYFYNCPRIEIGINNQTITLIDHCDVAKDKENDNVQGADGGGVIGNAIFKYCKKATFDFENMVFEVISSLPNSDQ
ncbi:retropepsin-like domain-containing protein [Bacteroidales bacterium OttesenSCG-928-B11]|nr:retropepsin-like domain-containing protein [Bacteroidales bacterium OttesenSCG-928-C03]MDL2311782.1 retropepsin-like domain-containing protein [Bacteroidales bacterium OttesenSCG-928-B11]